eukprot:6202991-Pleurochrysis_carterae.AAC.3
MHSPARRADQGQVRTERVVGSRDLPRVCMSCSWGSLLDKVAIKCGVRCLPTRGRALRLSLHQRCGEAHAAGSKSGQVSGAQLSLRRVCCT